MKILDKYNSIDQSKLPEGIQNVLKAMKSKSDNFSNQKVNAVFEPQLNKMIKEIKQRYPEAIKKQSYILKHKYKEKRIGYLAPNYPIKKGVEMDFQTVNAEIDLYTLSTQREPSKTIKHKIKRGFNTEVNKAAVRKLIEQAIKSMKKSDPKSEYAELHSENHYIGSIRSLLDYSFLEGNGYNAFVDRESAVSFNESKITKTARLDEITEAIFYGNVKNKKISTSFGDKTLVSLRNMIGSDKHSTIEITNAIFDPLQKSARIPTGYGSKTKTGLLTMIQTARYDHGGQTDIINNSIQHYINYYLECGGEIPESYKKEFDQLRANDKAFAIRFKEADLKDWFEKQANYELSSGDRLKSALMRDHKYFAKSQDHEVAYNKSRNRKGYLKKGNKIDTAIQSFIDEMINNKIQRRTLKIKNQEKFDQFLKDLQPAIEKKLIRVKINPKDKNEAFISLGAKATGKLFKPQDESSRMVETTFEIDLDDISPKDFEKFEKFLVKNGLSSSATTSTIYINILHHKSDNSKVILVQNYLFDNMIKYEMPLPFKKGGSIKDYDIKIGSKFILPNGEIIEIKKLFIENQDENWVGYDRNKKYIENSVKQLRLFINNWSGKPFAKGGELKDLKLKKAILLNKAFKQFANSPLQLKTREEIKKITKKIELFTKGGKTKTQIKYIPKYTGGYIWNIRGKESAVKGFGIFDMEKGQFTNISTDKEMIPYTPAGGFKTAKEIANYMNNGEIKSEAIYLVPHIRHQFNSKLAKGDKLKAKKKFSPLQTTESIAEEYIIKAKAKEALHKLASKLYKDVNFASGGEIEKDILEFHTFGEAEPKFKIKGEITPEFRKWGKEYTKRAKAFEKKYGRSALVTFKLWNSLEERIEIVPKHINEEFKNITDKTKIVEKYKGYNIENNDGVIEIVNNQTRFIIDLDDNKINGAGTSTGVSIKQQIRQAKEYIDWIDDKKMADGGIVDPLINRSVQHYVNYYLKKGGRLKSALMRDRKYFNQDQEWERRYSIGKNRKKYAVRSSTKRELKKQVLDATKSMLKSSTHKTQLS